METSDHNHSLTPCAQPLPPIPAEFRNNPLLSHDCIFDPVNKTCKIQLTFHNCITALDLYMNKSLEELRYEDYLLNRKRKASTIGPFTSTTSRSSVLVSLNPINTKLFR